MVLSSSAAGLPSVCSHVVEIDWDLFSQCNEQLSSTGHLPLQDYFVTGQFDLTPKKQGEGGFLGLWIRPLLRCD